MLLFKYLTISVFHKKGVSLFHSQKMEHCSFLQK
jgi:hypothetical protein